VAAVQAHRVVERVPALGRLLVAGVGQPPVGLQEDGGAEVLLRVPPVGRARGRAARAEDAFVETVELLPVRLALPVLLALCCVSQPAANVTRDSPEPLRTYIRRGRIPLQIRLNRLVLLVEMGKVGNQVLDDVGVRKRVDLYVSRGLGRDAA
jgi:hypothetical protein